MDAAGDTGKPLCFHMIGVDRIFLSESEEGRLNAFYFVNRLEFIIFSI